MDATLSMKEHTISAFESLFPSPRSFSILLWDGTEIPASGQAGFTIHLKHPGALRNMLTPPVELSIAEAYIYDDYDIQGDILATLGVIEAFASRLVKPLDLTGLVLDVLAVPREKTVRAGRGPIHLSGKQHSLERDRKVIRYHYDVGNDFYSLFLDKYMNYSCAYFKTGQEDLDAAQECKMEHICRKLRLKPGEHLLDIGCGWGGLARYAAGHYGVQVTGVTLSQEQARYAQEKVDKTGLEGKVNILLQDYRELPDEAFDKIISVGMFEHVGRSHLPEYFGKAFRLLKPAGLFLNHGIARRPTPQEARSRNSRGDNARRNAFWQNFVERRILGRGAFSARYIFPDGELVPVSDANLFAETAGFEVRDVENLREHYALTLRNWVNRLEAHHEEAVRVANETIYRTWRLYMSGSVYGFETGTISVNQSLLAKPANGKVQIPMTRADIYI